MRRSTGSAGRWTILKSLSKDERRLERAAGRVSPYTSEIAVTVVEGDHGAHLNPLVARIGLGAFRIDAPRSNSMAEVASQAVVLVAAAGCRGLVVSHAALGTVLRGSAESQEVVGACGCRWCGSDPCFGGCSRT